LADFGNLPSLLQRKTGTVHPWFPWSFDTAWADQRQDYLGRFYGTFAFGKWTHLHAKLPGGQLIWWSQVMLTQDFAKHQFE